MKRAARVGCVLLLLVEAGVHAPVTSGQDLGWTTLLDGTNLNSWAALGDANWRLTDGAAEATSGAGFLVSRQLFGDFDLRVEFWMAPEANSGVFIRCQNPKDVTATNCYEINAYDQRPDPIYRTGAIVNIAKPMAMVNAGNQWNTFEITARGPRLTVRLNGTQTADVQDTQFSRGVIALQAAMGTVRFRRVQIR